MKNTILLCALIAFFLTGNTARAETKTCKIEIKGSTVTWKGPCRDDKAYGNGRAEGANWVYEGAAHGGKARGQGTWKLDDGGSYSGAWREGVPHGKGIVVDADGDRYTGEWRDGKRHGRGSGSSPGGGRFTGEWRDGKPVDGGGEPARQVESAAPGGSDSPSGETSPPGVPARAEPVARKCKLEVNGESRDWSGPCSRDGRAYGNGQATTSDGRTYTGSARNGEPHGFGTGASSSGKMLYQGEYQNGVPHGSGTILGEDGRYYVSNFDNGYEVGEKIPAQGGASDESRPENAYGQDAGAEEAAIPGVEGDEGLGDDAGYDAALKALAGGDGVVREGAPGDDYDAGLAELERRERERSREALEIEDWSREKELEKERRAKLLKDKLRAKAAAIDAEKKRRWDANYATALQREAESVSRRGVAREPSPWQRIQQNLDKLHKKLKKQQEQRQRTREALERKRRRRALQLQRKRQRRQAMERRRAQGQRRQAMQRRRAQEQRRQTIVPPPAIPVPEMSLPGSSRRCCKSAQCRLFRFDLPKC